MKNLLRTLTILTLFSLIVFPQTRFNNSNPEENMSDIYQKYRKAPAEIQQRDFSSSGLRTLTTKINTYKTQLGNGFLLIENIYQHWDGSAWVNFSRLSYLYDRNNNIIEKLAQYWHNSSSQWVNSCRDTCTYDENNILIELLHQNGGNSVWSNDYRCSYIYDINNNNIEIIVQTWDGSVWINLGRDLYTYDVNNYLIESLGQAWNGSSWVNDSRNYYTYDENYNLIEKIMQMSSGNNWLNWYRDTMNYDGNNNLSERLTQQWAGSNLQWDNDSLNSYIYDADNKLTIWLIQRWNHYGYPDPYWENDCENSYTYDGNNNLTEVLHKKWNGQWNNDWKDSYAYDSNFNLTESLSEDWVSFAWVTIGRNSYGYTSLTGFREGLSYTNSYNLSQNFPNPFNPSTKIRYSVPKISFVQIKVFDVLGNEIETLVKEEKPAGKYEVTWNAADLPSGVYFYHLRAGDFIRTKKMILLK